MSDTTLPFGVEANNAPKGPSLAALLMVVALLTAIAGLGGWLLGNYLGSSFDPAGVVSTSPVTTEAGAEAAPASTGNVVTLKPILTNVKLPQDVWVRLEAGLVARSGDVVSDELASIITNDFMAFIRTVNLAQLRGASGLEYLRMDLEERAKLRSEGKVEHVLIWALVME